MKRIIDPLVSGIKDTSGNVVDSGQVYFYEAGTTTLTTVYQDFDFEEPHSNPATLDAAGCLTAYSDERIKIVVVDSDGVTVRTIDNLGTADSDLTAAVSTLTAGDGLVAGADESLDVNVDGVTITIEADEVKVSDSGIDTDQLADEAVTAAKIANTTITPAKVTAGFVDDSTIENTGSTLRVKAAGITRAKLAAVGQQTSSSSSTYNSSSSSFADVTNLSVSITTSGRPVMILFQSDNSGSPAFIGPIFNGGLSTTIGSAFKILRGATEISRVAHSGPITSGERNYTPPGALNTIDVVAAGTYTYKLQAASGNTQYVTWVNNVIMTVFEL